MRATVIEGPIYALRPEVSAYPRTLVRLHMLNVQTGIPECEGITCKAAFLVTAPPSSYSRSFFL